MRRIPALAMASFQELIRQPATLLLGAGGVVFILVLAHSSYFALGEEARQVKQGVLAFILVAGLLAAVLGASASVAREVRSGTALVVLSKPVGRLPFVLGKFLGLALVLGLQVFVHLLAALLAGRMAHGVEGRPDWPAIVSLLGALLGALVVAGTVGFLTRRSFVGDAVPATAVAVLLAFAAVNALDRTGAAQRWGTGLDLRLVPAGLLILMALLALAGLALAFSTRLEMVPTLALCSGVLLLGLLSDYLFGGAAAAGSKPAAVLQAVVPNWQVFWVADALGGTRGIPWGYVLRAGAYGGLHLVVALSFAFFLFYDREMD